MATDVRIESRDPVSIRRQQILALGTGLNDPCAVGRKRPSQRLLWRSRKPSFRTRPRAREGRHAFVVDGPANSLRVVERKE